ncbi:MAG: hypothetical protein JO130_04515 [Solirubrobacterales bacterium]|nr:hypothetical protein [Solirubrobacterales bacterium]
MKRATRGILAVAAALACALGVGVSAAQASLSVPTGGPATTYTGTGTAGVTSAIGAFERAVGGADNGQSNGEQGVGFRHLNWDDTQLDGGDPGSTVIEPGHVVAPERSRFEPWGLALGPDIAVANDGFHSVNPNANFTPFSPPNAWAPFNSTTAELDIVAPAGPGTTPTVAQTRGLGIVFLGSSGSSQIQYYNGDILLDSVTAPAGATSFAGLLFPDPVVTRVVVLLGGAELFAFDGSTVTPGGSNPVAADDVVLGEPAPARPDLTETVGENVSAVLDTFTDTDPTATPSNFVATVDWGDGTSTSGQITKQPDGSFTVTSRHAYAKLGTYTATVTVSDFSSVEQTTQTEIDVSTASSETAISCSPAAVAVSATTTCTVSVSDQGAGSTPTGLVTFSTPTPGAVFPGSASCTLGSTGAGGTSICFVQFSPGQRPPIQARVTASYGGDLAHAPSSATTAVAVKRQRCTLKVLSRRLRPRGIGVLVTCDAHTTVEITGMARTRRARRFKAFSLHFGSVQAQVSAGRPTVLVVGAAPGVLPTLRIALHRHQRVSLKLTLTAASRGSHTTTTTRVSDLRLP